LPTPQADLETLEQVSILKYLGGGA